MHRTLGIRALLTALSTTVAVLGAGAAIARADLPSGMPTDVPAAATTQAPALPEPSSTVWPFPSAFPQTSGTGRLDAGAELWSDFIYDDYGASSPTGFTTSTFSESSGLAGRQGDYVFPSGSADNNGADIFRAGIGLSGGYSYWRVDWVTLADPTVPIAEWAFDTDDNAATGTSQWPAQAGVTSAGIDEALVVSSQGAWLINTTTGTRTDVTANGGTLTVDPHSKSFIVKIPTSLLPVSGTWRIRLAAGLADASGQNFAEPYVDQGGSLSQSSTAERVYNITFRTVAQEPPVYTDGMSDALIAAAQAALAGTPVGQELGLDGIARDVTGNFWMEDDQADTLAGGDVSKFSLELNWSDLQNGTNTPEPQPTGYSARWYVSPLQNLGQGQRVNDGPEGDFHPTLLEPVQPYSVYVPSDYKSGTATPLTWILHSLEVNYNQYGALDPQLMQQLCEDRHSICATTEGFGPAGWYYNEAENDFWQVWRALAQAYTLDPNRTVISGYSMGGWASYKLAFEHPDDFAGSLVLDGPLVCGINLIPGGNVPAYASDPKCAQDDDSQKLIANAKWIPYVIDQTSGDELVPTTGVEAQVQTFDGLGQRYQYFLHTGGDHLYFAIADRFSDAVTAIGMPVRTTDPGAFSFTWYPALNDSALGLGATGDYWLSGLAARTSADGTLASIVADDGALPDNSITPHRFGPTPVSQPLPGTTQGLYWQLGAPRRPTTTMTLKLTDVSGLTVDAAAAKLTQGTVTVTSDGPARVTFAHLAKGTEVLNGTRVLATARGGVASASVGSGATTLTLLIPFACGKPTGRLHGTMLGPVKLGMTRAKARSLFLSSSTRGRRYMDFFCPAHRSIRVGYPSPKLLRTVARHDRRHLRGRVVLILTASHHFALRGVRPGTRLRRVARRLHLAHPFAVGKNRWYLVADGASRGVLKVQHGIVQEIGIATKRLTPGRRQARLFFTSFG